MESVSLVIPTYNEAENIKQLIDDISKTIEDIEIIVVDDNSPDGTASAVENLSKKYRNIRVFVREENKGLAPALLKGFDDEKGMAYVTGSR